MEMYKAKLEENPSDESAQQMLEFYLDARKRDQTKFEQMEPEKKDMEYDLLTTDWILQKVRQSESYAQNLYAAMCNNNFMKHDVLPILKEEKWHCSWRYAGGIIANMRQEGDYIDWYCSGIRNSDSPLIDEESVPPEQQTADVTKLFVSESVVTEEIKADLLTLGWLVLEPEDDGFI
jgi:hypothetical protein